MVIKRHTGYGAFDAATDLGAEGLHEHMKRLNERLEVGD